MDFAGLLLNRLLQVDIKAGAYKLLTYNQPHLS